MDLKYNDVVTIKNEVITSGTLTCKENLQTLYQDFYFAEYYEYDKTKAIITTAKGDPYLFPLEWLELKERYYKQLPEQREKAELERLKAKYGG